MWTEAPSIQICSCCSLRMEEKVHALGHGGGRQAPTGSRAETREPRLPWGCGVGGVASPCTLCWSHDQISPEQAGQALQE